MKLPTPSQRDVHELASRLAALDAFADCTVADLDAVAGGGQAVPIPAQWPLIQEGTPADRCYIVLEGQARVTRLGEPLATLGPGAVFGEVGLARTRLRNATVVSQTEMLVLCLPYAVLAPLAARRPRIAAAILGVHEAVGATSG